MLGKETLKEGGRLLLAIYEGSAAAMQKAFSNGNHELEATLKVHFKEEDGENIVEAAINFVMERAKGKLSSRISEFQPSLFKEKAKLQIAKTVGRNAFNPAPERRYELLQAAGMEASGRFMIHGDFVRDEPNFLQRLFAHLVVIKADWVPRLDAIEYIALGDLFELVEIGSPAPLYRINFDEKENKFWASRVSSADQAVLIVRPAVRPSEQAQEAA